jgi:hypothetical protein
MLCIITFDSELTEESGPLYFSAGWMANSQNGMWAGPEKTSKKARIFSSRKVRPAVVESVQIKPNVREESSSKRWAACTILCDVALNLAERCIMF